MQDSKVAHATPGGRTSATSRRIFALLCTAVLGGCASFSPDGGFAPVQNATQSHIQKEVV
jgi:hypothetical protein